MFSIPASTARFDRSPCSRSFRWKKPRRHKQHHHLFKRGAVVASSKEVFLLDYGAGNVRSVRNAIRKLGFTVKDVRISLPCLNVQSTLHRCQIEKPSDILSANKLIFPGVGSFGAAMRVLRERQFEQPLVEYLQVHFSPNSYTSPKPDPVIQAISWHLPGSSAALFWE